MTALPRPTIRQQSQSPRRRPRREKRRSPRRERDARGAAPVSDHPQWRRDTRRV